jgi:tetratricopeptide (TPR) repeat protein
MSNGMPDKALSVYTTIVERFPEDPYIHLSLSDYYRKQGDKERSFEEMKLGFANPDLDIDTKIQVMLSYYSVSEFVDDMRDQALELADILVKTHPDDPKSHSMRADFLVREERYQEARDGFRQVIALDSSRFLVWENLLRVEVELQDYLSMRDESKRMIELFPVQAMGYLFNGVANYQLKDYEAALGSFKQGVGFVVANNLLMSQFYAYLGDVSYQTGDTRASFEYYDKTLLMDPNNSYVLNNYAYYLSLLGENLERAESMAKKATILDPENSANLDTYGWVLYRLGKYQEAETWISKAIDSGASQDAVVLEHYGDVLFRLNDPDKALEFWKKAQQAGKGSEFLEKKITDGILYE